ncbi:MAG TPA: porin family protein [Gemmatimonadales bacterium]|nr:porin family protein [Gemmatimonadales bacterium]
MKRITLAVLAAAGFTMAVAAPAAAQSGTTLGVGIGITNPMGDWKDKTNGLGDKLGFHFGVGAGLALGSAPVRLRVEGSYTQTSHQSGFNGHTKLLGGMVSLVYPFATAGSIKPYVLAGVGATRIKIDDGAGNDTSKTSVSFGGGAGIRFPLSSMSAFVEARYLTMKAPDVFLNGKTTFSQLPITVGLSFPLGGKK